jgi:serine protease Do
MRTFPSLAIPTFFVCCLILAAHDGFATENRSNWATEAYLKNCESVIFIQGDKVEERHGGAADSERMFNGMGTGVIIDERGYILTNFHVVKDLRKIQVKTYNDDRDYVATIVAKDADTDLAIIKINVRTPLRPIVFGRSNDLMPGEVCMAIGNPYGYLSTVTDGRISGLNRDVPVGDTSLVYRAAIQTNAAINPGNSGGPLINVHGEMIGINVAIRQGANLIAFATPVDQVVEVAAKLMSEVVDQQVFHGLTVSQNEPRDYNAIKQFIIRVESVESNSPAALAGIQKGDIIKGIGKCSTIRNKLDFYRALLALKPNEEIAFTCFRNGGFEDVSVAVAAPKSGVNRGSLSKPSAVTATTTPKTANNSMPNEDKAAAWDALVWKNLGIQYAPIPTQEYKRMYKNFIIPVDPAYPNGFPDGGVRVTAVRAGSPAERTGILKGDLLVAINDWQITSADNIRFVGAQEWTKLQSENESILTHVIRDNRLYYTNVPMK